MIKSMAWCDYFDININLHDLNILKKFLSMDEKNRAERYKYPEIGERFIVCRGFLRKILSGYIYQAPEKIVFSYNSAGKPAVEGIEFNLTHTADRCIIAVSDVEIGIDMEKQTKKDFLKISSRYFSLKETDFMSAQKEGVLSKYLNLKDAFYASWCAREAAAKMLGISLWEVLDKRPVFDLESFKFIFPAEYANFYLKRLPDLPDFCIVICSRTKLDPVLFFPKFR